ncbi:Dienelactone hydrolase [Penicillium sp. DV-2018c]|nr:Dienelactone hydrolase [Penicillium sp. DV-2018c]
MVNIFQRFTRRRAQSFGNSPPEHGADSNAPNTAETHPHGARRTLSMSSASRRQRYEAPSLRHLILVSDTAEFDTHIVHRFQAEGFDVSYVPFLGTGDDDKDRKSIEHAVHEKEDDLETGERYAIVGRFSYSFLVIHIHSQTNQEANTPILQEIPQAKPKLRLHLLTVQNSIPPPSLPPPSLAPPSNDQNKPIPPSMRPNSLLPYPINRPVHLQTKRRLRTARLLRYKWHLRPNAPVHLPPNPDPPTRPASPDLRSVAVDRAQRLRRRRHLQKRHRCHVYAYPGAKAGFAERAVTEEKIGEIDEDLNADDELTSQLAWSRALGCLKRAFNIGSHWAVVDIETVWEEYWELILGQLEKRKQLHNGEYETTVEMLTGHSHYGELGCPAGEVVVNCVPTKAGGHSISTLRDFFDHAFIPFGPAEQDVRLLSRTIGTDRIVDEMLFTCKHTAEIPWLLPGVTPTQRDIKVIVIVVASFSAGQITRQSLYWDQVSVLVQVGLLDPALVPSAEPIAT